MGVGDWLMAAGEARILHAQTKLPVIVVGRDGRPQWSEVFDHNPYIARRTMGRQYSRVISGSGFRPYIAGKTPTRWTWKRYTARPAEMFFTPEELAFAEPYRGMVMVEPNVKNVGHTNKAWRWDRWQQVVAMLPNVPFVQCLQGGTSVLAGVDNFALTLTFRHALAVLSVCRAFVGTEGGLMHGAAAVGTPAVILWSEFISPDITGYANMRNIRHAGKACGNRLNCAGCRKSMDAITVDEVLTNLEEILNG